jgi:hypothetical protein
MTMKPLSKYLVLPALLIVWVAACTTGTSPGFAPVDGSVVSQCVSENSGQLPTGSACDPGAECRMTTARCPEGNATAVPSTGTEWDCVCSGGAWSCTMSGGGLSVASCNDGTKDAAVTDTSADLPACVATRPDGGLPLPDDLPIGTACSIDGAQCVNLVQSVCADGVKYRPSNDPLFECTCHGTWSCKVIGGGLGVVGCEAGVDDSGSVGDSSPE